MAATSLSFDSLGIDLYNHVGSKMNTTLVANWGDVIVELYLRTQSLLCFFETREYLVTRPVDTNLTFYCMCQTEEAIRYLEFCIEKLGNTDQAIHNYLLSLYIEQGDDESLLRYLNMQGQVWTLPMAVSPIIHSVPKCSSRHFIFRKCVSFE